MTEEPGLGLTHPGFTAASSLSLAALVFLFCCPPLHAAARSLLRPPVVRRVRSGLAVVAWLQARRTPALTSFFSAASATVSVPFYVLALPALQWTASPRLGARLSFALGAALYVGNALKDLVCAPRPLGLVVGGADGPAASPRRQRAPRRAASAPILAAAAGPSTITAPARGPGGAPSASEAVSAKEYGLPSSHAMNTAVMLLYGAHYFLGHSAVGRAWAAASPAAAPALCYGAALSWTAVVALARLYAGMHTPIDVGAGLAAGALVFSAWTALDGLHEAFLVDCSTSAAAVLASHAAVSALLLRLHPRPLRHTPSYEASTTFLGACSGVALGVWRSGGRHLREGGWSSLPHGRGPPALAAAAALRLAAGFATAAVVHLTAKAAVSLTLPLAYRVVPLRLRRLWQPPLHSLTADQRWARLGIPLNRRGRPWDEAITARFLSYAALGWAVSDGAFVVGGAVEAAASRRWP